MRGGGRQAVTGAVDVRCAGKLVPVKPQSEKPGFPAHLFGRGRSTARATWHSSSQSNALPTRLMSSLVLSISLAASGVQPRSINSKDTSCRCHYVMILLPSGFDVIL